MKPMLRELSFYGSAFWIAALMLIGSLYATPPMPGPVKHLRSPRDASAQPPQLTRLTVTKPMDVTAAPGMVDLAVDYDASVLMKRVFTNGALQTNWILITNGLAFIEVTTDLVSWTRLAMMPCATNGGTLRATYTNMTGNFCFLGGFYAPLK